MIAIVDDDDGVRSATRNLLEAYGHRVATFASAEEFLNSERLSATPSLITDVQMPGINGIELLERLKANGYTFPVIVITAFPDGRVRDRVLQLGACCLLTKPFGGAGLADWVEKAIRQ